MVIAFGILVAISALSLIAIQAYQSHIGRKVLIHLGIIAIVLGTMAGVLSIRCNEVTYTHTTLHADYYGSWKFSKVMTIDYDTPNYHWWTWHWLQMGPVNLTIKDERGEKIITE